MPPLGGIAKHKLDALGTPSGRGPRHSYQTDPEGIHLYVSVCVCVSVCLSVSVCLAGLLAGLLAGWLAGWRACWLPGWVSVCLLVVLARWLVGLLAGWLAGWLGGGSNISYQYQSIRSGFLVPITPADMFCIREHE